MTAREKKRMGWNGAKRKAEKCYERYIPTEKIKDKVFKSKKCFFRKKVMISSLSLYLGKTLE